MLLSRLLYVTEGTIGISSRNLENFEMFCPLGAMKLGVQQKKLLHLIQLSQDSTYIFGRVLSIYGALLLLNFCGDRGRGLGARTKLLGVSN